MQCCNHPMQMVKNHPQMAHKSVRGEKESDDDARSLHLFAEKIYFDTFALFDLHHSKKESSWSVRELECTPSPKLTHTHIRLAQNLGSEISFCLNVFLSPFSNFRAHSGNFFSGLRWNDHDLWMGEIFRQISNKCLISSSEQWTGDWKIGIAMECLACSNSWEEISKGQRFVSLRLIQNKIFINIKRTFSQIKPL